MPESVRIIITGGTLDKEYDQRDGRLVFTRTHLPDMLKEVKCTLPVEMETLQLEDSLDMTDADREAILGRCRAAAETRIVITHGTDTMTDTARLLGPNITDRTVVLVGAMVPYAFVHSDALFNLGCALTAVQTLGPGVYITMNGRVFTWDNVLKNRGIGIFACIRENEL